MKESAFQRIAIAYLKGQPNSYWNVNHGGIFSGSGRFDIEGCIQGSYVAFELKTPKGRISNAQEDHWRRIREAGGWSFVVTNMTELREYLEHVLSHDV